MKTSSLFQYSRHIALKRTMIVMDSKMIILTNKILLKIIAFNLT